MIQSGIIFWPPKNMITIRVPLLKQSAKLQSCPGQRSTFHNVKWDPGFCVVNAAHAED